MRPWTGDARSARLRLDGPSAGACRSDSIYRTPRTFVRPCCCHAGMPSRRRVCDTAHSNLYRLLIKQTSGRSELSWAGRPPNSHSRVPRNSMRRSSQDQGLGVPGSKVLSGLHNLPGTRLAQHGNPCCAPTHQLGCGRAPGASAVGWNGGLRHRWRWCSEPARLASLALDMALIDKARHEANTQGFGKEQRQGRPALLYVHSSQPLVHPCVA